MQKPESFRVILRKRARKFMRGFWIQIKLCNSFSNSCWPQFFSYANNKFPLSKLCQNFFNSLPERGFIWKLKSIKSLAKKILKLFFCFHKLTPNQRERMGSQNRLSRKLAVNFLCFSQNKFLIHFFRLAWIFCNQN